MSNKFITPILALALTTLSCGVSTSSKTSETAGVGKVIADSTDDIFKRVGKVFAKYTDVKLHKFFNDDGTFNVIGYHEFLSKRRDEYKALGLSDEADKMFRNRLSRHHAENDDMYNLLKPASKQVEFRYNRLNPRDNPETFWQNVKYKVPFKPIYVFQRLKWFNEVVFDMRGAIRKWKITHIVDGVEVEEVLFDEPVLRRLFNEYAEDLKVTNPKKYAEEIEGKSLRDIEVEMIYAETDKGLVSAFSLAIPKSKFAAEHGLRAQHPQIISGAYPEHTAAQLRAYMTGELYVSGASGKRLGTDDKALLTVGDMFDILKGKGKRSPYVTFTAKNNKSGHFPIENFAFGVNCSRVFAHVASFLALGIDIPFYVFKGTSKTETKVNMASTLKQCRKRISN